MWNLFTQEHPNMWDKVTIIWSDGTETDCIWDGVNWNTDPIPVFWKNL